MKKILVPVDFSACSDNAALYAIRFAEKAGFELVFFHWIDLDEPDKKIEEYALFALRDNISGLYKSLRLKPEKINYRLKFGSSFHESLAHELAEESVEMIIMGTEGVHEFFHRGYASATIADSPVPVLCIPCKSDAAQITEMIYFTDLSSVDSELENARSYATMLNVPLSVVHFDHGWAKTSAEQEALKKLEHEGVSFKNVHASIEIPLLEHVKNYTQDKHAMICLFHDHKNALMRFLTGSSPEEAPFTINAPVLSFQRK